MLAIPIGQHTHPIVYCLKVMLELELETSPQWLETWVSQCWLGNARTGVGGPRWHLPARGLALMLLVMGCSEAVRGAALHDW